MSNQDIKADIKARGNLKARLTAFNKFLDDLTKAVKQPDGSTAPLTRTQLINVEKRLDKLENVFSEFETNQTLIESLIDDSLLETQYNERQTFEDQFFELTSSAKSLTETQENVQIDNSPPHSLHSNRSNESKGHFGSKLKLPPIKLAQFSGSFENWIEFRETFNSLIHNREDLHIIEKFHYLKASLDGEAAQVIKSIEFTPINYDEAWNLLCERYNNDKILVNNHIKALFSLPKLNFESASKIRELIDNVSKHLQALKSINLPTDHWDALIIYLITTKLDEITSREWEEHAMATALPTLDQLKQFLKNRADLIESLCNRSNKSSADKHSTTSKPKAKTFLLTTVKCSFCQGEGHKAQNCSELSKIPTNDRCEKIKAMGLCINCLGSGHSVKQCRGGRCHRCGNKHNTLLHFKRQDEDIVQVSPAKEISSSTETTVVSNQATATSRFMPARVLLSTAQIVVSSKNGKSVTCRALLDSGSQANFITKDLSEKLGVNEQTVDISVSGIGHNTTRLTRKTFVQAEARCNGFKFDLECLILPEIGGNLPSVSLDKNLVNIPDNVVLADPSFNVPGRIDILIGSSDFWALLSVGQIRLGRNLPLLQETRLGWVVVGPTSSQTINQEQIVCSVAHQLDIRSQLEKFWQLEETNMQAQKYTPEESECERLFKETTQISCGRFVVRLPLKGDPSRLGDSRENSFKRLKGVERRLRKDAQLSKHYNDFMLEYSELSHMQKVSGPSSNTFRHFIPHHPVIKPERVTTKVRVVFDASAKTSSNVSLNDLLMVGPTIQQDLFTILLRFRKHNIALTADITKMYRQVLVAEDQRYLQSILWRSNFDQTPEIYELNTVTYGTAPAAFLAIRCLHEVAYQNTEQNPVASRIILSDFYVDDLLTGASTLEEAIFIRSSVSKLLSSHGFPLRKWASSCSKVLENEANPLEIGKGDSIKTLGLLWKPQIDAFAFSVHPVERNKPTKPFILSVVSRIFDPIGLLAPTIILTKIILQRLWVSKVDWDESLPLDVHTEWLNDKSSVKIHNSWSSMDFATPACPAMERVFTLEPLTKTIMLSFRYCAPNPR